MAVKLRSEADEPPEAQTFILDPAAIADELLLDARERAFCIAAAASVHAAVARALLVDRVPLDDVMPQMELLRAYVETNLVARVTWPELFPIVPAEDDDCDWRPQDSADAAAMGLSVIAPPRKRVRSAANLPGCHGSMSDGLPCHLLRRRGELYCPAHRKLVLQSIRRGR